MTFRGGTHDLWVRYWLAAAGINPDTDISTIVIPPPQMVANMKAGTQDAFCVGEPWNGQLVNQKAGYTACLTSEIWMNHPEKALGMRADWVDRYPRAAQALITGGDGSPDVVRQDGQPAGHVLGLLGSPVRQRADGRHRPAPAGHGGLWRRPGRSSGSPHYMKFWADNASFPYKSHDLWFVTENQRWGVHAGQDQRPRRWSTRSTARTSGATPPSRPAPRPASDSRGARALLRRQGVRSRQSRPPGWPARRSRSSPEEDGRP